MNWLLQSPMSWSENNGDQGEFLSSVMSTAEALNNIILNVNNLIYVLKDSANSTLRSDLTNSENERVAKYINGASQALNRIALDFYMISPSFSSPSAPSIVKSEDEEKSVAPFKDDFDYLNSLSGINSSIDIDLYADPDCLSIGAKFETLEDALYTFQKYANKKGFNICKGNSKQNVYQEYACSARGKARKRETDRKRNRKSTKTMCKCHIILRKKEDCWTVTTSKLEHTHSLLTEEQIKMTAKNRYIPDHIKAQAIALYQAGESPAKIQYFLENEYQELCTWSMKDLYNMLYRRRETIKEEISSY
ncbi:unnamed protein product [Blepharisma stoltei]|uniref:FAR1 domain-containing protein n=1 Tax=Blepharisma stoltei TaxID=1481888 RepID=A0AAU9KBL5_9CILI|nr:unnamed protein product [Blepharisma stoltei]